MKKIENVFVIVDKPKHEQVALRRAFDLQRRTGAHLHLAAFAYHTMCDRKDVFDAQQRNAIKRSILRERTEWLRGRVLDAGAAFEHVTLETVWCKDIAAWTAEKVHERGFDLVVKSAHRRETILHTPTDWLLLRDCPAPVLLAIEDAWPEKLRVLAALDVNANDQPHRVLNRRVLATAALLTEMSGGGVLHCVYAIEISRVLTDLDIIDARKAQRETKARAAGAIGELLAPYDVPGNRVHLPVGKVGAAVNSVAGKVKADIMVIGTTARKGMAGLVVGNSAERVLAKARCDVLAVKP